MASTDTGQTAMSTTDQRLLQKLASGSREAFQALYQEHVRPVYAVALRVTGNYEDAEEATQDAFMDLVKQKERCAAIASARAWLIRVASRRAVDLLRKRKAYAEEKLRNASESGEELSRGVVAMDALASVTASGGRGIEQADMMERIRVLSARLPERQMLAFTLRHFQSMSITEVAEVMGCSDGAVKAHLHIGLTKLRDWLEAEGALGNEKKKRKAGA